MNTKTLKCMTAAVSLLAGIGGAFSAYAAGDGPTARGIGSNDPTKDKIGATDVYLLACPPGTSTARAKINEGNNDGVQLSVQVINPHGSAVTESGVNGGLSPEAILAGGQGSYLASVHKNGAKFEGYTLTVDCHDANGNRFAGDQATLVQDQ